MLDSNGEISWFDSCSLIVFLTHLDPAENGLYHYSTPQRQNQMIPMYSDAAEEWLKTL